MALYVAFLAAADIVEHCIVDGIRKFPKVVIGYHQVHAAPIRACINGRHLPGSPEGRLLSEDHPDGFAILSKERCCPRLGIDVSE